MPPPPRPRVPSREERLLTLLNQLPGVDRQNRLMRIGDRALAICLCFLESHQQDWIIAQLTRGKAERVRDELQLQKHLSMTLQQYHSTMDLVLDHLGRETGTATRQSYLRPLRPSRGTRPRSQS